MTHGQTLALFTKRGPADRLAREAALLQLARHPGVVDLVELRGEPDPVLVTRLVDGPSLAEGAVLPVDDVAGLVAVLATTVADLHRLGLAHNSILPEHVLVASGGRPILCGLADGVHPGDSLDFARDVAALGELLRWLLARAPQPQGSRHRTAGAVPALLSLALRATSPDPRTRPTADALATGVRAVAPHATLPGRAVSTEAAPRRWPRVAARAVVAAAIVSVTLVGVMGLDGTTAPDRRSRSGGTAQGAAFDFGHVGVCGRRRRAARRCRWRRLPGAAALRRRRARGGSGAVGDRRSRGRRRHR